MIIIVEGVDKAGKTTFIRDLGKELVNKDIATPSFARFSYPSSLRPKQHQADIQRFDYFWTVENSFSHYTRKSQQVLICDRFHLGEAVYPQLYRDYRVDYQYKLESMMPNNVILVLLSAHHEIIKDRFGREAYLARDDIRKCIKLFDRAYGRSIIPIKMRVYAKYDKLNNMDSNQNMAALMASAAIRDLVEIIGTYTLDPITHTYQVKSVEEISNVH